VPPTCMFGSGLFCEPERMSGGAAVGDVDGDGDLDLYVTRLDAPDLLFLNLGNGQFQDGTAAAGLAGFDFHSNGAAFADIDNDGDQDIYNQLGGFYEGDGFRNALFVNPGHGNRFLHVKLVGTASTRTAVGARIRVELETPRGVREIHRAVGSVSSFGGSPLRQEIGLGDATRITRLDVWWPRSGIRQTVQDVPMDTMIRMTEGSPGYDIVELRRLGP